MAGNTMNNVFWLVPNQLAGRSGPSRDPWSLPEPRAGGFDAILNLTEIEPDRTEFVLAQLELGWVPLPATYPANFETEQSCLKALPKAYKFLISHLEAGHKVLVHCAWGRDRTGLLLAYYLARSEKLSPKQAIARLRKVRPEAISPGWEEMSERVIAKLQAD